MAGVLYREAPTADAAVLGQLEVGILYRVDNVIEVDNKMRSHICEPEQGWVLTMSLRCKSRYCGLCTGCLETGPRATLPSENSNALGLQKDEGVGSAKVSTEMKLAPTEYDKPTAHTQREEQRVDRVEDESPKSLKTKMTGVVVDKAEMKQLKVERLKDKEHEVGLHYITLAMLHRNSI